MRLTSFSWPKILAAIVAAVVVGVILLFQFTSFQTPKNLIQDKPAVTAEDHKLNLGESSVARNNLDEVHDIIHGMKEKDDEPVSSGQEHGNVDE